MASCLPLPSPIPFSLWGTIWRAGKVLKHREWSFISGDLLGPLPAFLGMLFFKVKGQAPDVLLNSRGTRVGVGRCPVTSVAFYCLRGKMPNPSKRLFFRQTNFPGTVTRRVGGLLNQRELLRLGWWTKGIWKVWESRRLGCLTHTFFSFNFWGFPPPSKIKGEECVCLHFQSSVFHSRHWIKTSSLQSLCGLGVIIR